MPEPQARRRRLIRRIVALTVILGAVPAVGAVLSRWLARGDERSSDLVVAAIGLGRELKVRSEMLRSLSAIAVMGGIELDLTDAVLDPGGAALDVLAVMGGVDVAVPDGWAVQVEHEAIAGGVEVRVPRIEDLPPDAPLLSIHIRAYMGGVQVSATES